MFGAVIYKYLIVFLVSMVPIVELRGAIPIAAGMGLPMVTSYIICVIGNMLPVPIIFLFARKVLIWGADKKYIGKFFSWCIDKGERGGEKLKSKATLCCPYVICRNTSSGNRCMDGNIGSKLLRYGF